MRGERGTILVAMLVVIVIIGGAILLLTTRPDPVQITIIPPLPTAAPDPTVTPAPVTVYVTGAVAQPNQSLVLPAGSRVENAVEAAGGVLAAADLNRVNMAARLRDGDQIHIPAVDEVASSDSPLPTASGGTMIYINSATLAELETLPGIGPAIAQRILDYRQANGRIADFEALDQIEGIGPAMIGNLQGLVAFD